MAPKFYKPLPPQAYLQETFSYYPDSGELRWKLRPIDHFQKIRTANMWNAKNAYKEAGNIITTSTGAQYRTVKLDSETRYVHRIIWKLVTGTDPTIEVDHEDNNGLNNRWYNLREATSQEQIRNTPTKRNNSSGYKGVRQVASGRYATQINIGGNIIHLGTYDTAEEAYEVFCTVSKEQYGEFFNPN